MQPRILIVSNLLSGSLGIRAQAEELAERLSERHRVIATSTRPERARRLVDMVATTWQRRNEYDVALVDVFSGAAFVWAECTCAALRLAGKPYILGLHGGNLPSFAARSERRVRKLLSSAAAVVAPSPYLLKSMQPYRPDLRMIPNAIDLAQYSGRVRVAAGPNILWLRAFHRIYNPVLAVEVFFRIQQSFPNARLKMVGPNKHDGSLEATWQRIRELRLADSISVIGRVPKTAVPQAMAGADIYLNTSNIDNTPVTVIEAMSVGLCIVSTNVGGMPDLLDDGREGVLVNPGDPDAMAAAVESILGDKELARSLSANAINKAADFDWSRTLPRWSELLASVSNRNCNAAAAA